MTWRALSGRPWARGGHYVDGSKGAKLAVLLLAVLPLAGAQVVHALPQAGGSFTSSTPPTLTLLLLPRASVSSITMNVSHAPISVECLFSMTLQQGGQC